MPHMAVSPSTWTLAKQPPNRKCLVNEAYSQEISIKNIFNIVGNIWLLNLWAANMLDMDPFDLEHQQQKTMKDLYGDKVPEITEGDEKSLKLEMKVKHEK
mgnify:CR=1 FL=1